MDNEIMEAIERRDEVIAEQYAQTAKDFRQMAKKWAEKGVYASNYEQAHVCCVKADAFDQLAQELRRPALVRKEREPNREVYCGFCGLFYDLEDYPHGCPQH